ncbi:two component transcriptional regulator, LuxR family [Sphingomonas guangdongensis]|uniref:Two component transcriptional regulator, LuxR family n=1 Tax=Sphingomonas guangdongensis TaxID=1141890 RepID=A0A285QBB8_9SPHN|nr:response regulator transcription factor [Sphingomonas guangdongensis]SOB78808.1 two component transcriptional regulator, LuxR family [Sphingomonas guangdongensis]
MQAKVNVALIGKNLILREGLQRILSDAGFVVSQSLDVAGRFSETEANPVAILLDESRLTLRDDVEHIRSTSPGARIVCMVADFDYNDMCRAFGLGVDGLLTREIACPSLIASLQLVAAGEKVVPSKLVETLKQLQSTQVTSHAEAAISSARLTEREVEILNLLSLGYPNKLISRKLDISDATVKVHVKALMRKLQVQNRTQAAIWARRQGLPQVPADSVPEPRVGVNC